MIFIFMQLLGFIDCATSWWNSREHPHANRWSLGLGFKCSKHLKIILFPKTRLSPKNSETTPDNALKKYNGHVQKFIFGS